MSKKGLNKEVKNYERNVTIVLVVLTAISLIIDFIAYTGMVYSDKVMYETNTLRTVMNSGLFMFLIWVDNIAIYITNLFYFAGIIDSKRDMIVKIAFMIFSVLSIILINLQIVNLIADLFGIF